MKNAKMENNDIKKNKKDNIEITYIEKHKY